MEKIRAVIRYPTPLRAKIKEISAAAGEPYTGPYTVTPRAYAETILPTKNKHLTDDVQVQKIPYYDVSNAAGGSTVYIAKEI